MRIAGGSHSGLNQGPYVKLLLKRPRPRHLGARCARGPRLCQLLVRGCEAPLGGGDPESVRSVGVVPCLLHNHLFAEDRNIKHGARAVGHSNKWVWSSI